MRGAAGGESVLLTRNEVVRDGFGWVAGANHELSARALAEREALFSLWEDLVLDVYMADGGTYRRRRFGCFALDSETLSLDPVASQSFFQGKAINSFAGGIKRTFAPLDARATESPLLRELILEGFQRLPTNSPAHRGLWKICIHQVRIVARPGEAGKPTPEGIHRDGHDFLATLLVSRHNVSGGASVVFDDAENRLSEQTFASPLDALYLDDQRLKHYVTPVRLVDPDAEGHRDVLIIDYEIPVC